MVFTINQYEFGQRPPVSIPTPEFLKLLSEEGIRKMVSDHYDLLSKSKASHLFPRIEEALDKAKQRSSDFFIQICGGHTFYTQNRGRPMLAARHSPFAINQEARIVWLECYIEVLSKLDIPEPVMQSFWDYLNTFSFWMVNTKEE
jgi:hemoglobin